MPTPSRDRVARRGDLPQLAGVVADEDPVAGTVQSEALADTRTGRHDTTGDVGGARAVQGDTVRAGDAGGRAGRTAGEVHRDQAGAGAVRGVGRARAVHLQVAEAARDHVPGAGVGLHRGQLPAGAVGRVGRVPARVHGEAPRRIPGPWRAGRSSSGCRYGASCDQRSNTPSRLRCAASRARPDADGGRALLVRTIVGTTYRPGHECDPPMCARRAHPARVAHLPHASLHRRAPPGAPPLRGRGTWRGAAGVGTA